MRLKKYIFLSFIFISTIVAAQNIYVCESYTHEGEPINHKLSWTLKKGGDYIYVLLKEGAEPLNGRLLYMFIDKSDDGQYYPFDSKAIKINHNRDWVVYRYKFEQEGKYSIYFQDTDENEIAQKYVTINLEAEDYTPVAGGSLYYEGSNMVFCEVVINGKPINKRQVQSLGVHGRVSYVYINNFRPLNTEKILVYIWRKQVNSFDYEEFIESKKYKVDPDWEDTFFRYVFKEPGEYKMVVYNENELILSNGFIKIVP